MSRNETNIETTCLNYSHGDTISDLVLNYRYSTEHSAAVVALSRYLDTDGMDTKIADDGQSVRVANADHSYHVSLDGDGGVEGDGPHRSQLEEAVEKVRAAIQAPNE